MRQEWLARLEERGARLRAEALLTELDVQQELRLKAEAATITEARRLRPAGPAGQRTRRTLD